MSTVPDLPNSAPRLITDQADLTVLVERLKRKSRIALDTEAASFHRYVDRVYLVQASSDAENALIDPLAVADLSPIGALLADPEVEKIFHDADYDLRILDRDYGFRARRLFDTRVAAQLLGETAFGLGSLLETSFGVRLDKKLQRADWSMRPLTAEMIAYAAADTAYLPALRDALAARLAEAARLSWAEEEFLRLEAFRWTPSGEDGEAFLRIKGARALPPESLAVLRELYAWREETARALDRASFRVIGNEALVALAKEKPASRAELGRVGALPRSIGQRHGEALLGAIRRGIAVPPEERPRFERTRRGKYDPAVDERLVRLKALRAERAGAVGLDPGLVCPNGTLLAIAKAAPREPADLDAIPELRRWQREVMGEAAVLRAVSGG